MVFGWKIRTGASTHCERHLGDEWPSIPLCPSRASLSLSLSPPWPTSAERVGGDVEAPLEGQLEVASVVVFGGGGCVGGAFLFKKERVRQRVAWRQGPGDLGLECYEGRDTLWDRERGVGWVRWEGKKSQNKKNVRRELRVECKMSSLFRYERRKYVRSSVVCGGRWWT